MQAEDKFDQEALAKTNVKVGDWYYLPMGKDFNHILKNLPQNIRDARTIDFSQPVIAGNKTLNWIKIPSLAPGIMHYTSKIADRAEAQQLLICTTISVPATDPKELKYAISWSAGKGNVLCNAGRHLETTSYSKHNKILNDVSLTVPKEEGIYSALFYFDLRNNALPYFQYQVRVMDRNQQMDFGQRMSRRNSLLNRIKTEFIDPASRIELMFDEKIIQTIRADWIPNSPTIISQLYKDETANLLNRSHQRISSVDTAVLRKIEPLLNRIKNDTTPSPQARAKNFTLLNILNEVVKMSAKLDSMKLAVDDQINTFKEKYPNGKKYLKEIEAMRKSFDAWIESDPANNPKFAEQFANLYYSIIPDQNRILLDNPLLKFEKLLVATGGVGLNNNWSGPNRMGTQLQALSHVSPNG